MKSAFLATKSVSQFSSSSAFLQSIIPEPVRSRSRLTSAAVKFDMLLSLGLVSLVDSWSWWTPVGRAAHGRPATRHDYSAAGGAAGGWAAGASAAAGAA